MTFSEEEKRAEEARLELERKMAKIDNIRRHAWEDAEDRQNRLFQTLDASAQRLQQHYDKLSSLFDTCGRLQAQAGGLAG